MSAPAAVLERVWRRFGSGDTLVEAVRDVTLAVERGRLTLVQGPSGSGKTTLLSIAGALLPPSEGRVEVAGQPLAHLAADRLALLRLHSIGFVFQAFRLVDALSLEENVELPLNLAGVRRPESRRRARELVAALGLAPRARLRPGALSGGEKQRAAIARALANDPPLLLADEPTGSLDARSGQEVIALLHEAAHRDGRAVLVVSHDPRVRASADRVWLLEDGALREPRQSE